MSKHSTSEMLACICWSEESWAVVAVRESSLEWVELRESFKTLKSFPNELMSFFTLALNSTMLLYIDLTTVFRLIRFASTLSSTHVPAEGKIVIAMKYSTQSSFASFRFVVHVSLIDVALVCALGSYL